MSVLIAIERSLRHSSTTPHQLEPESAVVLVACGAFLTIVMTVSQMLASLDGDGSMTIFLFDILETFYCAAACATFAFCTSRVNLKIRLVIPVISTTIIILIPTLVINALKLTNVHHFNPKSEKIFIFYSSALNSLANSLINIAFNPPI
jgi:hypothetical protein